jgi:hypothetical protein
MAPTRLVLITALVMVGCNGDDGASASDGSPSTADSAGDVDGAPDAVTVIDVSPGDSLSAADNASPDTACSDPCPAPSGVTWSCKKRFMYGANWAWLNFAGDFGGIAAWGQQGVSKDASTYAAAMGEMKSAGVSVIRWWMFPRFWTESISWGSDDAPSGVGGTLVADIQKALELAAQHDMYVMLTPFSFDNFEPTTTEAGIYTRGIQPMVVDAARRQKLLQNLVVPVAQAVESSPHRARMIAWDMMNEPEWAMTGASLYGGEAFSPQAGLQAVSHTQMESFLKEMAAALHQHSSALVSIGSAAIKWASAWTKVDVDFYQLHYYGWVYEWYPYSSVTLASVGLTGKPVVMGEFPLQGLAAIPSKGLPARTAAELAADLWSQGYAGTLAWAYNDSAFPWDPPALQVFAAQHACETRY